MCVISPLYNSCMRRNLRAQVPSSLLYILIFITECSQPVDLAFLVDGSGSIDPFRQFPKVRKFLKQLAAAFHVGPAKTKIALVQFSGKVSQKVEFGLNQYSDLKGIIEGIDRMEQLR